MRAAGAGGVVAEIGAPMIGGFVEAADLVEGVGEIVAGEFVRLIRGESAAESLACLRGPLLLGEQNTQVVPGIGVIGISLDDLAIAFAGLLATIELLKRMGKVEADLKVGPSGKKRFAV